MSNFTGIGAQALPTPAYTLNAYPIESTERITINGAMN